jgi:hypothetical protein
MRHPSAPAPRPLARHWPRVLLIAVLCAALGAVQGMALTPAAAAGPQAALQAAPAAAFLATLAADAAVASVAANTAGLPPALAATGSCTSDSQCLPDKLCCRACGYVGCTLKACLTPRNGHCPLIP